MATRVNGSRTGFFVTMLAIMTLAIILMGVNQFRSKASAQDAPTAGGKPNFSGIWQTNNEANFDLEAHQARPAQVTQPGYYPKYDFARVPAAPVLALGATAGVPGSLGVVQGDGIIPYKLEAAAKKKENAEHWVDRDPEVKCYLPGIPRAMYMPYPFEIVQGTNKIEMVYTFSNAARTIHMDKVDPPPDDTYMGFSQGHWEGNTLVVDVTHFNGKNWFDRAGNFASSSLHLVERFTPISSDIIRYEVTVEDPEVYTRPWRIAMPIYRRVETNIQLIEYPCIEFAEEFMYGHLRNKPLVQRWKGETMEIEIKRKIPPGERFYEWYGF